MLQRPADNSYSLLFVDDHPIYCDGLAFALSHCMPNLQVLTVRSGAQALAILQQTDIDLVLSDYRLAEEDGVGVLKRIAQVHPSIALGLLCAEPTPMLARQAATMGAVACLSKERDMSSMADVLRRLFEGESVYDSNPHPPERNGISDHRLRIIRLAAGGSTNKEIARCLEITERTVKDHWAVIFERLGASNRIQAIQCARDQGLIERS